MTHPATLTTIDHSHVSIKNFLFQAESKFLYSRFVVLFDNLIDHAETEFGENYSHKMAFLNRTGRYD